MKRIKYPKLKEIIEYNKFILKEIKVKKSDKPKVLSLLKIRDSIQNCKKFKGDIYNKATCLLENLIQKHPFASGNRRTSLFTTLVFLKDNNVTPKVKNEPKSAKVLIGIREGFYNSLEINNWLENGKIRKFKR